MNGAAQWQSVRRLLCIRLDNMGDVLMTTPAIRALKRAHPARHISLLVSSAGACLAPFLPDVDEVMVYDAPWVRNDGADPAADADILATLRQGRFDAAVIFTVYSQSPLPAALMCRLAGIPLVLAHCRENPYRLLSHWQPETEPDKQVRHESRRQLDLVAHAAARCEDARLVFKTRDRDGRSLRGKLRARGLRLEEGWMVAHCGASAPSRRYPVGQFAQALKLLDGRAGTVLLTGDAGERQLTREVAEMCAHFVPVVDLAGELSLGELACLIEGAPLLLANNTGPVHLAAALGTPVVVLYALTNPQHTPWKVPHRTLYHDVPCRYCYRSVCPQGHHACLRGVAPETVCAAVLELLAETRQRFSCHPARAI